MARFLHLLRHGLNLATAAGMMKRAPSHRLFLSTEGGLAAANDQSHFPRACVQSIEAELSRYFRRSGKPRGGSPKFQIGLYGKLGGAVAAPDLRADLLYFFERQENGPRDFYAVFQPDVLGDQEFLQAFRSELSHLDADDAFGHSGGCRELQFTFTLDGQSFLVSALHPLCPESELRFRYPTLVFRAEAPALAFAEAG